MKRAADCRWVSAPQYVQGLKFWLFTRDLPFKAISPELSPSFNGPFPISKIVNLVAVRLQLPRTLRRIHLIYVSCLKPVFCSALAHTPCCIPTHPPSQWFRDGPAPPECDALG
ncbi:hypothetical protein GJAV_G00061290 [Gymnothorax javanicus]|nr:hypothetical protein GJAV_G00061290 [Gymnothorax javanicus]